MLKKEAKKDAASAVPASETAQSAASAPAAEKKGRKPAVKPAVKKEKKPAVKPAAKKGDEVFIQFGGSEWNSAELVEKAKAAFVAQGHRASTIKHLALYVKPEEQKAYYVINDKSMGSVEL